MDLTKILSISGKPDLYKHIAQSKTGIIVESLSTEKRMNTFASMKISTLHDIAVFTEDEDLPISDVFRLIFKKENGGEAISPKSSAKELKKYFEEVLPTYDKYRVYISDIKRIVKWYNLLQKQGLIDLKDENSEDEAVEKSSTE